MVEIWFAILVLTLILFTILDGWNIGAGALHLVVARTDPERRAVIAALGPLWSWNEVWLLAAGGVFILAFPPIMAAALAGFYLAIWLVLWSLLLRGMAIEIGGHVADPLWRAGWDVVLAGSSFLLALLFGVAIGNVVRGVPIDETGRFSMSLFTNFDVRGHVGILDWYTVSTGLLTTALLGAHGATYLRLKTQGPLHDRSEQWARGLWLGAAVLFVAVTVETRFVQPQLFSAMSTRPGAWLAVTVAAAGVWALWSGLRGPAEVRALVGSCAVIAGLLAAAAVGLFPTILPSTLAPEHALTAYGGATAAYSLTLALVWWPFAFALAAVYFTVITRAYRGKVPN